LRGVWRGGMGWPCVGRAWARRVGAGWGYVPYAGQSKEGRPQCQGLPPVFQGRPRAPMGGNQCPLSVASSIFLPLNTPKSRFLVKIKAEIGFPSTKIGGHHFSSPKG
jgi:hypothetical protein